MSMVMAASPQLPPPNLSGNFENRYAAPSAIRYTSGQNSQMLPLSSAPHCQQNISQPKTTVAYRLPNQMTVLEMIVRREEKIFIWIRFD